jgi:hypothetical protein
MPLIDDTGIAGRMPVMHCPFLLSGILNHLCRATLCRLYNLRFVSGKVYSFQYPRLICHPEYFRADLLT